MTKEPPSDLNALVAEAVADLEDGLLWGGGTCVVGYGGIHGALPNYMEVSEESET